MRFGLKNAPATVQSAMDVILASVKWQHAIINIDETIISSKMDEEHLKHIDEKFLPLRNAGMAFKLKKCLS